MKNKLKKGGTIISWDYRPKAMTASQELTAGSDKQITVDFENFKKACKAKDKDIFKKRNAMDVLADNYYTARSGKATDKEARIFSLKMLQNYNKFPNNYLDTTDDIPLDLRNQLNKYQRIAKNKSKERTKNFNEDLNRDLDASERIAAEIKVLSASDEKFIVVGKSKEGTVYWTDHGFLAGKEGLAEVALVDEETADKIKRRNEHRHKDVTDIQIKEHSSSNDNKRMKADDGESADNYEEDDSDAEETEDSNGDDFDDAEVDELVDSLIDFVNTNNIPRSALNKVFDQAMTIYSNDLKNNGPIDDSIGFIVDTFGPEEAEIKIKALANMQTLQKGGI